MSRKRTDGTSGDVNSQPQPYPASLMALMEAKVSHGNKQAQQHGKGREMCRGKRWAWSKRSKIWTFSERELLVVWYHKKICIKAEHGLIYPCPKTWFNLYSVYENSHNEYPQADFSGFTPWTVMLLLAATGMRGKGKHPGTWRTLPGGVKGTEVGVELIWPWVVVLTRWVARLPLPAQRGDPDSIRAGPGLQILLKGGPSRRTHGDKRWKHTSQTKGKYKQAPV